MLSSSPNAFPSPSIPTQQPSQSASNSNPLVDLIRTEREYLETLKLIDSQIAPIWMKQTTSTAPDFSEQLAHVHAIYAVNKQFCLRLVKVAGDSQAMRELGDILMQWVDTIEVPYASFLRNFVLGIDRRNDITDNPELRTYLMKISPPSSSWCKTFKALFDAPLERVKYYKSLYNRLLQSTRPGRADHGLLLRANQRIDTLIQISKNTTRDEISKETTVLHDTNRRWNVTASGFLAETDCSRVVDLYTKAPVTFHLQLHKGHSRIILRDDFVQLENDKTSTVHLALSTDVIIVCRRADSASSHNQPSYALMYPPIAVRDVTVKSMELQRELAGEYFVQLNVAGEQQITLRIGSRERRNTWLGVSASAPGAVTLKSRPLTTTVKQQLAALADIQEGIDADGEGELASHDDIYALYSGNNEGEHSGESATQIRRNAFRDTVMELYDRPVPEKPGNGKTSATTKNIPPSTVDEDGQHLANIVPRSVKLLPRLPDPSTEAAPCATNNGSQPPKTDMQSSSVKMTYIEPAVHKISIPTNSSSNTTASPPKTTTYADNPVIPRSSSKAGSAPRPPAKPQQQVNGVASTVQALRSALTASTDSSSGSVSSTATDFSMLRESSSTDTTEVSSVSVGNHYSTKRLAASSSSSPSPVIITPLPRTSSKHTANRMPVAPARMTSNNTVVPQRQASLSQSSRLRHDPVVSHAQPMQRTSSSSPTSTPRLPEAHSGSSLQIDTQAESSLDDLASPPQSPGAYANATKQVLYRHGRCDVFHWKGSTWYAAQGRCGIQVRVTNANRTCISILLLESGQLYLNAWIFPTTTIQLQGETDVSVSVHMGTQTETYLVHFERRADAVELENVLLFAHRESVKIWGSAEEQQRISPPPMLMRSTSLMDPEQPPPDSKTSREEAPQTLKPLMQCRCKLFAQQEHAAWSSMGSVSLQISQQEPSNKMHIYMENGKTKLVSAIVQSCNVERFGPKRVSFLLSKDRSSMVYMINLKEERTANKIFEYIKIKNAQNGW